MKNYRPDEWDEIVFNLSKGSPECKAYIEAGADAMLRGFINTIKRDYPETLFLLEDLKFWHDIQGEIE